MFKLNARAAAEAKILLSFIEAKAIRLRIPRAACGFGFVP